MIAGMREFHNYACNDIAFKWHFNLLAKIPDYPEVQLAFPVQNFRDAGLSD